jgi:hypothetical protein
MTTAFPHICAGDECAVCGWVDLRNLRLRAIFPYEHKSEGGKVEPRTEDAINVSARVTQEGLAPMSSSASDPTTPTIDGCPDAR